jgi:lysophospholipase L1-like esterase
MARKIVFEGTSITAASWFVAYRDSTSTAATIVNTGVNGSTIATIIGRAATVDGNYSPGDLNLLVVEAGANNFGGGVQATDEATLETLFDYCDDRRAAGWKVLLATLLPQSGTANVVNFNAARSYINPLIRAAVGTRIDAVVDWAADPLMGAEATAANTTYFTDGLHPSNRGKAHLSMIARRPIDSFLSTTQKRFRLY